MNRNRLFSFRNLFALSLGLLALGLQHSAEADDRQLFQEASDEPYVFILFDSTGSMQWLPGADDNFCASQSNLGLGNPACAGPLIDDDPTSRLYQAKEGLDIVLQSITGVRFGFATFPNHRRLRVTDINGSGSNRYINSDRESSANPCSGIEPNNDSSSDTYNGYRIKFPTSTTPVTGLSIGDLIPFDWNDDNVQRIRERLAPNLASPPTAETVPDYGIARYFRDRRSSDGIYRLRDEARRPFLARNGTPLGASLANFKSWFDDWKSDALKPDTGDEAFIAGCRKVSVILVTDGVETCGGNPVAAAGNLHGAGIDTYVIGFSQNSATLNAIAAAGGTDQAFFAGDQAALIAALQEILGELRRQARTFATAAVPSVVGSSSENVYLTSFSPTEDGVSLWPGRVDSYKKPVPLVNVAGQQVPDRSKVCADPDNDDNCLAWSAADKLLDQAPDAAEVVSDRRLGFATDRRRVYYGRNRPFRVPEPRRLLDFQSVVNQQNALYGPEGFGFPIPVVVPPATAPDRTAFVDNGESVIKYFLREKTTTVLDPLTRMPVDVDYVMADIFHSDPAVVAEPTRFDYFAKDVQGEIEPCGPTNDEKDRYPCFVRDSIGRRRVLLVGSNEGALHAFDAGSAVRNSDGFLEYTAGTGQELFAYVPRSVMPSIRGMWNDSGHVFTMDGPVTVDDVLRDPFFNDNISDFVNPADREWRTVVIGGLREGGRAYYALDITQPDRLDTATGLPIPDPRGPGCTNAPSTSNCKRRYPESLWEFTDTWDEDNNGAPDLAETWSKVNSGRIRLDDGLDAEGNPQTKDLYVAIFGGGMDADFKRNPISNQVSGNYLYMVDIETGKLVYKRRVDTTNFFTGATVPASTPSEPAAVDLDQDSYLDTIYIGNTAGYMYKVDVSEPVVLEEDVTVNNWACGSPPCAETVDRIMDSRWEPFPIFSTLGRPIYHAPSIIFVPELARFAVAFGTGDREDLWSDDLLDGRFYVLLDDDLKPDPLDPTDLPFNESELQGFVANDPSTGSSEADLLADPNGSFRAGYYLRLENTERVITKSFGLSGVIFFSSYLPTVNEPSQSGTCASTGNSRLYSVFTRNGAGIRTGSERFKQVSDFVTQPYVESSGAAGKNVIDVTQPPPGDGVCDEAEIKAIRTSLMAQMPAECRFAQYSLNVMTLQSQSGLECTVQIPVCVVQRNWKEF